jgi:hypothetical protein
MTDSSIGSEKSLRRFLIFRLTSFRAIPYSHGAKAFGSRKNRDHGQTVEARDGGPEKGVQTHYPVGGMAGTLDRFLGPGTTGGK